MGGTHREPCRLCGHFPLDFDIEGEMERNWECNFHMEWLKHLEWGDGKMELVALNGNGKGEEKGKLLDLWDLRGWVWRMGDPPETGMREWGMRGWLHNT